MSEPTSLYRKFTGTAGIMIISRCLAMVLGIIYARYLGPEQFGLYSFVLSIIAMATLPVVAGLPNLLVREVATFQFQEKWGLLQGIINWSRLYILGVSLIVMTLMSTALYFNVFEPSVSSLLLFALFLIPLKGLLLQQSSVLNGLSKPVLALFTQNVLGPLLILLAIGSCIILDVNFTAYNFLLILLLVNICLLVVSLSILKKSSNYKSTYLSKYKAWHKSLVPFFLVTFFGTLNLEAANIAIGIFINIESVGYFKVAIQGVSLIVLASTALNSVIMPSVVNLYKNNNLKDTQLLLKRSVNLSFWVALPILVVLLIFGKLAIFILFGESYLNSYPILVILSIGYFTSVLAGSVGVVLNMTGNEGCVLKTHIIIFFLNFILLALLIPNYGAIGAAIATSTSLVTFNIIMAFNVWNKTKLKTWVYFSNKVN